MSNAIQKRILMAQKGMTALRDNRKIDKASLFGMFIATKDASIDALILSHRIDLLTDYRRFLRIRRNGFVSPEEIVNMSGIKPDARLGEIILMIKKAQFIRNVTSKKQALSLIKAIAAAEDHPKSQKTLCSGDN